MQILGQRSKILLIAVAIAMLAALGLSFALWDTSAVKASNGSLSEYANAKIGDEVTFGQYFQTAGSAAKSPITWLVVDKNERTGQLTLMSKYILAYGSYFGNYYYDKNINGANSWTCNYMNSAGNIIDMSDFVAGTTCNQAWAESTARAFLNNLERFDLGGDIFDKKEGLLEERDPSVVYTLSSGTDSMRIGDLKASVGFSNARYWTDFNNKTDTDVQNLVKNNPEFMSRNDDNSESNWDVYYQRAKITEPSKRLARNGFLDEAFSDEEMSRIVPRNIPGTISHRWPDNEHFLNQAKYVEGTTDRVWLPSAEELNIKAGQDWAYRPNDSWTTPSDFSSSEAFEYFKNYKEYTGAASLADAIKTTGTPFAEQANSLGNYSIPGFVPAEQIGNNISSHYWTRSPASSWYRAVRNVSSLGIFDANNTDVSGIGVRPCVILKY